MNIILRLLSWSLICCALISCASYRSFEQDVSRSAHNRINKQEIKKLAIVADDYSSEEKSLRYFDRDLRDMGYLPIYMSIENAGENEFILRMDKVSFRFEDGTRAVLAKPEEVIAEAESSHVPALFGFLLGIIPGPFMWGSISDANFQLHQDYEKKSLRNYHIKKGNKLFGFIFVKIPEGKEGVSLVDSILEIEVVKQAKGKELAKNLKFIVAVGEG